MPNILYQIRASIKETKNFFSIHDSENDDLTVYAINFLNSQTYGELETNATEFMNKILEIHGKINSVGGPALTLNMIELHDPKIRDEHRLHFVHLINVFLLGLYIYHSMKQVKEAIINDIVSSPNEIPSRNGLFNYSGGTEEGEFQYRWRLTAIGHDIGYPIELSKNRICNLLDYIKKLDNVQQDVTVFSDFERYNDWNIFSEIDSSVTSINLRTYALYQKTHPAHQKIFHDHGIYGANLFLRLMHESFDKEPCSIKRLNNYTIIFDLKLLHRGLKKIARAIALHNLDSYEDALKISQVENDRLYKLYGESLAWLLKISDELQEWYKFQINNIPPRNIPLPPVELSIELQLDKIIVHNFPKSERDIKELLKKFMRYYSPSNLIQFDNVD
ncbi:MAG: hypothetical protein ABIJ47_07975 [Candidatus Bathyarchaeota archaeon]